MATETPATAPWQARPVFISSTFADMQAERDYLRTHVFPRLEEKLRARRHRFEPIDLRLGVETVALATEEERELQVLKVCLDEIERSRPYLIVLLGDRYGTVAAPERMQAAVQEKSFATELTGKSITALEIEFGLMQKDAQQRRRSFIYLREPLPYAAMAPAVAAAFSDACRSDPEAPAWVEQLQALKARLQADPELAPRIHPYHAAWDDSRQCVSGLEDWGEQVFAQLWAELDAETRDYASAPPQTWQQQERAALQEFVDQSRRDFTGREALLIQLSDLALTAAREWTAAKRGFLFPVWALSKVFRGKFVTALQAARDTGKLHGEWSLDAGPWRALLARLHAHEWVVYAKQPLGGPAQVLEYLGRYTHRVAISNERIVAVDGGEVRFRVRDSAAGNRKRILRLPAATFIDRFLLHVLPQGFKRIRHYGLLGPAAKAVKLAQARAALAVPAPDSVVVESVAAFMCRIARIGWARCPHCGQGDFVPTAAIPMPTRPALPARGPP